MCYSPFAPIFIGLARAPLALFQQLTFFAGENFSRLASALRVQHVAVEFIEAVWQISPYKAEKLLVQLACADWANADGEFWPTYEDIAHKSRVTKPGAIGIMQQLIEDGDITLIEHGGGGRGKRNRYRFSEDYLLTVSQVRQAWAGARERKGKARLPKADQERVKQDDPTRVNEDDPKNDFRVNENDEKGKREPAHIRNNRHKPSEGEKSTPSPSFVGGNGKLIPFASPSDAFGESAIVEREWTIGERFVLKACDLWEKPIVETNWKLRHAVKVNGKWVSERLDVAKRVGGNPSLFREFWFEELHRTSSPRPEWVAEHWDAYDRWLIANHETHRQEVA